MVKLYRQRDPEFERLGPGQGGDFLEAERRTLASRGWTPRGDTWYHPMADEELLDSTRLPAEEAESLVRGFRTVARREFAFLDALGYRLSEVRGPLMTWHSERADLSMWMNPRSDLEWYDAEIALRPAHTKDHPHRRRFDAALVDLAHWAYTDLSYETMRGYVTVAFPLNHTVDHTRPDYEPLLVGSIGRLARTLREEFTDLLVDREGMLDRLATSVMRRRQAAASDLELSWVRPKAQRAFKAGEWQRVIDLYTPLRDFIRGSEQMRIDYARRRLAEEQDE